jgi:hypothetical protein
MPTEIVLTTADCLPGVSHDAQWTVDIIRVRCFDYMEADAFSAVKLALRKKAHELGGDAVIAIDFQFETNSGVRAVGTVIKVHHN